MKDDDDDIIKYFDLNYCMLIRASNLLYIFVREFKKLLLRWQQERHNTIEFNEKSKGPVRVCVIVSYTFWHNFSPHSAKQTREITKMTKFRFCVAS